MAIRKVPDKDAAYGRAKGAAPSGKSRYCRSDAPKDFGIPSSRYLDRMGLIKQRVEEWRDLQGVVPFSCDLHAQNRKEISLAATLINLGAWEWRVLQILRIVQLVSRNDAETWIDTFALHSLLGLYWSGARGWDAASHEISEMVKMLSVYQLIETKKIAGYVYMRISVPFEDMLFAMLKQVELDAMGILHPDYGHSGVDEAIVKRKIMEIIKR